MSEERRYTWEYERRGRGWYGDWGPVTSRFDNGTFWSLRHAYGYHALTERGIRRKLAKLIRRARRKNDMREATRRVSSTGHGAGADK